MATAAAETHKPWSMKRVVAASSAGTAFEWYDFFIFGSLATTIQKVFFAGLDPTAGLVAALGLFAAGFAFRPLGAIIFGVIGDRLGRKGAFLATVSLMGGIDLPDRRASDLCNRGDRLPDPADPPAHPSGYRARRRIWRGGDLRRRTCARQSPRSDDRLDPDYRVAWPDRRPAGHPRHPHIGRRASLPRMGLAGPVPRFVRAADHLGLASLQAVREPRLREAQGRRRRQHRPAARSVRTLGQSETRADRLLRDHVRAGRRLVLELLLRPGLPDPVARRPRSHQGRAGAGDDRRQRAAVRLLRLAVGPRRPQAGDDRRNAAGACRLLPGLSWHRVGGESRIGPGAGDQAGRGPCQSRDLLGAVRPVGTRRFDSSCDIAKSLLASTGISYANRVLRRATRQSFPSEHSRSKFPTGAASMRQGSRRSRMRPPSR